MVDGIEIGEYIWVCRWFWECVGCCIKSVLMFVFMFVCGVMVLMLICLVLILCVVDDGVVIVFGVISFGLVVMIVVIFVFLVCIVF